MLQHRPSIKYFLELRTDAVDNLLENTGDYTFSMEVKETVKRFEIHLSGGGSALGAEGLESGAAHEVTRGPACPDNHLDIGWGGHHTM